MTTKSPRGYVYFIQAKRCRLIKIGYSDEPLVRLRTLQLTNADELSILAVKVGNMDHEHELHAMFAKARLHGEWFRPTKRLLRFIADVLANHDQAIHPRPVRQAQPITVKPTKKPVSDSIRGLQKAIADGVINPFTQRPFGAVR